MDFSQIPSPCYVIDQGGLRRNLELLQRVQNEAGVDIILALKGYSLYPTFGMVKQYLAGATASSLHEARLVVEEMGQKAHTYCPAYLEQEFDEVMGYSSHLTFNSLSQWERYRERVRRYSEPLSCGIRINPQYSEVETDLYNPAIPGSRLGMVRDQLGDTLPEGMEGLHFHTLCENNSHTLARTLEAVEKRFGDLLQQAKWLNMGGGHLITHQDYEPDHLIGLLKEFKSRYPHLKIIMEPGSAIGWQTGVLRSSVLDVLDSQGVNVALLDVSVSNHMPDCLEMPYKPEVLGTKEPNPEKPAPERTYRLGGLTCLAGDFVGDYVFERPLQVGDTVVFDDMAHYTMVKTTTFNGVNLPSIGMWTEAGNFQLFKSFGYESFKDRLG
ncbi:MAG TPA: carboxynorspermidine decarboxylase [Cytophagales bacterium]|nr:carboxynorspermidine decarboxylase [Cytophagales bacterium]HAA19337.1 carboxynorspermidine decarboxylase [Cytophagales bacterium]HAP58161.1 carboxynorspermidine decarboxylase [Cytophagales bacterium]